MSEKKHFNIRVVVEEVTEASTEVDRYGNTTGHSPRQVLELVEFKTQRPTVESAAKAAIGAINLAVVEADSA